MPPTALNAGMSNRPAQQSRIVRRDPLDHGNQRLAENLRHERVNAVIGDAPDRRLPRLNPRWREPGGDGSSQAGVLRRSPARGGSRIVDPQALALPARTR